MITNASSTCGPERDLLRRGISAFLLWWLPWLAFALGYSQSPALRTVLWITSLAFMGVACLMNAFRCGRVHSYFTGPFFILGAIVSLGYGVGFLPFGPSGWKWIGTVTIIGAIALCCIPEFIFGRYRRKESDSA